MESDTPTPVRYRRPTLRHRSLAVVLAALLLAVGDLTIDVSVQGMERSFDALRIHARNQSLRLGDLAESILDGCVAPSGLDPVPT